MKKLLAVSILFLMSCRCGPVVDPNTPNDPPPDVNGDVCDKACAAWEHFAKSDEACKTEAEPNADGTKCADLCRQVEAEDWTTMYPECIPKAKNCQEAKYFSSNGCK